jgi:NAD+ synthetase
MMGDATMKIALAQINPTIGDFSTNVSLIGRFADQAIDLGCHLVVFPELAVSGYPPRDLLEKPEFLAANQVALEQIITNVRDIGIILGTIIEAPHNKGKSLFNGAVLCHNGRLIGESHKRLLPSYDVFDERRYFEPGSTFFPIGFRGAKIGLTICEDAWNDEDFFQKRMYDIDPVARLVKGGADLIVNISASPYHLGKGSVRHRMLASLARKHRLPLVFVNQVGGNDDVVFDGISSGFAPDGRLVSRARDFESDLVVFDTESSFEDQAESTWIHPISGYGEASVLKALVLGTRDYVTKCGFSKVVIGLSGGIDSAVTAAVAVKALGSDNVAAVFMPSPYTSADNFEDTALLSANLGIDYRVIPIDGMFQAFLDQLMPAFDAGAPTVAEQNIQARIRGTILMALSNSSGALVLSTGNKSELAVGYCTLYGDMNGGLSVISDVPKTLVYELARIINRDRELIPNRILDKAPSAELKPDQTDQDDLPDYGVLDAILKGYIEAFKSPDELTADGFDRDVVTSVIRRVDMNEYKRHQAAPGIKVTSKAFGYGRRYPIAQRFRRGAEDGAGHNGGG